MNRVAFFLLVTLAILAASSATAAERHFAPLPHESFSSLSSDFDGDHKPDLLIGSPNGPEYTLEIRFSSKIPSALLSFSNEVAGLSITVCDVNRDDAADLVIQASGSRFPSAVWLGDGKGHFVEGKPWDFIPLGMGGGGDISQSAGPDQVSIALLDKRVSPDALIFSGHGAIHLNRGLAQSNVEPCPVTPEFKAAIPARSPPDIS